MSHHRFQHDVLGQGGIEVRFDLEFDGNTLQILNISIHSDFDSGIPRHPKLVNHNGKDAFLIEYKTEEDGKLKTIQEYVTNELSNVLITEIRRIQLNNLPTFH